jgi:HTH-type transcriptional regulator/antitoxin MqsA
MLQKCVGGWFSKRAAQLFGGGVNAFDEYERGVTKPAKSTMLLVKMLN